MLQRGLDHFCVSTQECMHENDAVLSGVVCESFIDETNVRPPAVTDNWGAG